MVRLFERFDNVEDGYRFLRRLQSASKESADALVHYLSKLDDAKAFKTAAVKLDEADSVDEFVKTVVNAKDATNAARMSKLTVEEISRSRVEAKLKIKLKISDNPRIDWIDEAGKTYDQMGNPNMIPHWDKQKKQFLHQIDIHLAKADHPVIDLTNFPNNIKDDVLQYINNLPSEQANRIIRLGF